MANTGDDKIRAALRSGDPVALEMVWDSYAEDLFTLLLSMLRSRADAEDVLMDVFVRIAQRRRKVATARDLRAYLLRMARNLALNAIKRRGRGRSLPTDELALMTAPGPSPAEAAQAAELGRTLTVLPEAQRTVVMLKVYRGMTFREIARVMGTSQNTAASRFRYALEKLRVLLGEKTEGS